MHQKTIFFWKTVLNTIIEMLLSYLAVQKLVVSHGYEFIYFQNVILHRPNIITTFCKPIEEYVNWIIK